MLYVLEEESERVKPMTVHPRPDLLSHPPDRIPMLPVIAHPDSVAPVSDAQREVIAQHRAMMPVEQPRPPRAPPLISDITRARMLPYTPELSLDEKLHLLATVGGKFLVSDDFVPNYGTNVRPYPPSTAPRAATEAHMGGNQRKGRVIVLPLAFARAAARAASLPFHTSPTSIQLKLDAEPPLGRMTSDYTYPVGSSM